jgi:hypothetical protein
MNYIYLPNANIAMTGLTSRLQMPEAGQDKYFLQLRVIYSTKRSLARDE